MLAAAGFACAVYIYLTLPDVRVLRTQNPPTTAFIELRTRQAIEKGEPPRRVQRWVNYSRISPNLTRAVIVTEDSAFWEHGGVDFQQMKESMEVNLERMEFARGASTITQQLAKNLYLSPSKNPDPEGPRDSHRAPARSRALEAADPRALPEPHRVGERDLWRRGRGAHLLRQVRGGAGAAGIGAAGGRDRQPARVRSRPAQARLRRRQEMILRRMGAVTLPPVVAEPLTPAPPPETGEIPGPSLPVGAPTVLPGEVVPQSKPPGPGGSSTVKPPGTPPG